MTTPITDVDNFDDPVNAVSDGDAGNFASFVIPTQSLSNRTRNLKNRIDALVASKGDAGGIATLDGSSRLVQMPKPGLVGAARVAYSGSNLLTTSSSTFSDVPGAVINGSTLAALNSLVAGDIVWFDAFVTLFSTVAQNAVCKAQFFENAGAWTDESLASYTFGPDVAAQSMTKAMSFSHVVGSGGAFGIKLIGKAGDGSTSSEVHLNTLRLFVIRP
jgi:hypothetical protein